MCGDWIAVQPTLCRENDSIKRKHCLLNSLPIINSPKPPTLFQFIWRKTDDRTDRPLSFKFLFWGALKYDPLLPVLFSVQTVRPCHRLGCAIKSDHHIVRRSAGLSASPAIRRVRGVGAYKKENSLRSRLWCRSPMEILQLVASYQMRQPFGRRVHANCFTFENSSNGASCQAFKRRFAAKCAQFDPQNRIFRFRIP